MKILRWIDTNILLLLSLFFLVFIPLYPKLPILGISHVFVYVRIEDFLVAFAVIVYFIQLLRKKTIYQSVLTIPIFLFWGVGLLGTILALIFIFPHLNDPNITNEPGIYVRNALLFYGRHIEYLSLFFIAYASIKQKKQIGIVISVITVTLLLVIGYGFGQRLSPKNFPAYSTMNEEFAKGVPLELSPAGRIQSTFAGHYDLAAYLVLIIPLIISMLFGFKNWWVKGFMFLTAYGGLILLLLTASRVSFAMYLLSVTLVLILQKQKKYIIPIWIISIATLSMFQGISARYLGTISQVDLVVDARTGKAVGVANQVTNSKTGKKNVVIEDIQSTGENLPTGSSYISIPGTTKANANLNEITYKRLTPQAGKEVPEVSSIHGDFVIKKAFAYDVSFTTRFQGEWPRATDALKRDYLFGSGYSSISAATDNNYLRMLGETGILGLSSFLFIFVIFGIYTKKIFPDIESRSIRSLIIGVLAGLFGLGLNAVLIDVFEASKVAFVLWLVMGITVGFLHLYQKQQINYKEELKEFFMTKSLMIGSLLLGAFILFGQTLHNFFVADDFFWLRGAADCKKIAASCLPPIQTIVSFFADAQNFFYRPGVKTYFYVFYGLFGLNPFSFHVFSVFVHFFVAMIFLLLAIRILKNKLLAYVNTFLFLILSTHLETIAWISTVNHLLASFLVLLTLYLYVVWRETKKWPWFALSFVTAVSSTFFHELGFIAPAFVILYDLVSQNTGSFKQVLSRWYYYIYLFVIPVDIVLRTYAHSVWSKADYTYNLAKLPFNTVGNLFGYILITFMGVDALPFYKSLRAGLRDNPLNATALMIGVLVIAASIIWLIIKHMKKETRKILAIGVVFFIVPLLPFLGLGGLTTRYDYLASFGLLIIVITLIHEGLSVLLKKHKRFVPIIFIIIIVAFAGYQIVQSSRVNKDWQAAGVITHNMLQDLNNAYTGTQIIQPGTTFFFVKTPVTYGNAWVFPVGLDDALWFTFQNLDLQVKQASSAAAAVTEADTIPGAKVFEFDKDNSIVEVTKVTPMPTPVTPVLK